MADPHDDPVLAEAIVSPSAPEKLPDLPVAGGGMESEGEKESSSCRENAGCSGDGEGGMEVTSPSSDCGTVPAGDSDDCASAGNVAEKGNALHGSALPAPPAPPEDEAALLGVKDVGAPSVHEDEADTAAPGIVLAATAARGIFPAVTAAPEIVLAARAEGEWDGEWLKAIGARDCLSLMDILKAQKNDASRLSLCLRTGEQGRTALHVAAMQGCFRLAKQLIDLVCESYPNTQVHDDDETYQFTSRDGIKHEAVLSLEAGDFMYGKDGRSGLSAFEMANDIIGNTSISQYIRYVGRDPGDRDYSIMYEAYNGTPWHMALAGRDCKRLEHLLKMKSHLLLETCGGLSVLDVAILKGDEKLVKQVMGFFRATTNGPEIRWKESHFPAELRWEQIAERPMRVYSVGSIFELAEKFGRSKAFKELLQNFKGHVRGSKKGAVEVPDKIQDMLKHLSVVGLHENDEERVDLENDEERVDLVYDEERVDLVYNKERVDLVNDDYLQDMLDEATWIEGNWNPEWTAGFMADVDYNFEDRHSLLFSVLRLNYAYKNPRQCMSFLLEHSVKSFDSMVYFYARDGQGRTPFHTMVDHYNSHDLTLDELCEYAMLTPPSLDSRGRSPMIRALTKQFLEQKIMVSSHHHQHFQVGEREANMEFIAHEKLRDRSQNNDISMFQGLYLASFLYEDVNVLRLITSEEDHKNEVKDFTNIVHVDSSRHELPQSKVLFIAAGLGNQTLLREWFKFKFDGMVEDEKGRTALHYAADANLLEFMSLPTSFFCSVDYPKRVEEEWMKRRTVERANLNVGQDTNGNPQSNASVGRKACILMLLQAGVDLSQVDKDGNIPDPGASSDTEFQSWWYNLVVKDSEDKKNSFNQAGNALSVVGTLVAATSYIGPLQPPLSYSEHNGYVDTSRSLVKVFMWTNTLAFYLAVASVMFAVVPSLPMPQEGVVDELRRARHTVSSSLFLLLASIVCILVSFAAATAVVVDNGDYYGAKDFLLSPSVIGWFFCLIAMVSFFIRVMRLVFFRNSVIRQIYKLSFSDLLKRTLKWSGGAVRKSFLPTDKWSIIKRVLLVVVYLALATWLLKLGLIRMRNSMGRGLRRLWKERVRHQEPGSSTARQVSPQRPIGPIDKLGDSVNI